MNTRLPVFFVLFFIIPLLSYSQWGGTYVRTEKVNDRPFAEIGGVVTDLSGMGYSFGDFGGLTYNPNFVEVPFKLICSDNKRVVTGLDGAFMYKPPFRTVSIHGEEAKINNYTIIPINPWVGLRIRMFRNHIVTPKFGCFWGKLYQDIVFSGYIPPPQTGIYTATYFRGFNAGLVIKSTERKIDEKGHIPINEYCFNFMFGNQTLSGKKLTNSFSITMRYLIKRTRKK
jgi:hypothetical protein